MWSWGEARSQDAAEQSPILQSVFNVPLLDLQKHLQEQTNISAYSLKPQQIKALKYLNTITSWTGLHLKLQRPTGKIYLFFFFSKNTKS